MATVEQYFRHYADVAFYAEQLNVSPRYLGQVTRRVSGRSPMAIIDDRIIAEVTTRAPYIEEVLNDQCRVLSIVDGHVVAAKQGHRLATAFHPELTSDDRMHRYFIDIVNR